MKKLYLFAFILFISVSTVNINKINAQCDINNFLGATPIPVAAYPFTNLAGITVTPVVVNANPLTNFTYNCGPNAFAGANPAWWINAPPANASITLNFSAPVCNFTILVNGTNTTEEFYFACNNGAINIIDYCATNFTLTGGGTSLLCTGAPSTGTIIVVDNPAGATQYVLTHNGLAAGSRVSLLDCYVGCNVVPPTHTITCSLPNLSYCVGESTTVDYVATGPYNPGNVFTAELSDPFGSFAAPVVLGSVVSQVSGTIPVTIPLAAVNGNGYRVRVNSSNPPVTGTNNGVNIAIHEFPNVVANASPASVCAGGNLTLTGGGAATYVWTGGVVNGVPFVPLATDTYTVTGTDMFNCSNTASVTVPVFPNPVVTANVMPSNVVCAGTPCTLTGAGAVSYIWTNPVIDNVPFTPLSTATYTVVGTDANNCTGSSTIQITVNPLPVININVSPSDIVCAGNPVTLTASGATQYSWSGGIQNGIAFTPQVTANYTVTASDVNNCSTTLSQLITVNPLPVVNLGPDMQLCEGDQVILDATTMNATYLWQNGTVNSSLIANQTGLYWVQVNVGSCIGSDSVLVTVNPYPVIELGPDRTFCEGSSVLLDATCPGCTYLWDNSSTQATRIATQEGLYSVTVSSLGCSTEDSIFLDQLPLPVVDLGPDTTICRGDKVKLDAFQFGASYLWQDNSKLSYFNLQDVGVYWVEVTVGQCTGRDDIVVSYSSRCECPLLVPNAFSPNGDRLNDEFRLINTRDVGIQQFSVYNRYGQEVFKSTNPNIGWEGNFNGVECEMGTYFYVVRYKCNFSGKDYVLKGDVTLVR